MKEFDLKIKDKRGVENLVKNHLPRMEDSEKKPMGDGDIDYAFPE